MDYISQGDNLSHITNILDNLELNNNNKHKTNKYYMSNTKIIKKVFDSIVLDEKLNTDPIDDKEFDPENKLVLNSNFLNLYDFINISSIFILNKNVTEPNKLIKLLVLTYIYKDIYLELLTKYDESNSNSNSNSNLKTLNSIDK